MIQAFGYIRVSSEGQVDGDGLTRQRKAIETYAKANGIRIVRFFEEQGVSGTVESIDRPAFNDMLAALLSNGTRTVIIERLDRIARDIVVQENIIKLFKQKHLELVSVAEPDLCSDDMYRVAMRQMLGVFAELDRKSIVYKLRAARQRARAKNGRCEGRKPFGTREGEQAIISRMMELKSLGGNWETISRQLNAEGLNTRTGSAWFPASVRRTVLAHVCNDSKSASSRHAQ